MPQEPKQTREQFTEQLFSLEKKDNYLIGEEAQKKLIIGIEKGVALIAPSYGASGSNAAIQEDMRPFHRITNDGKMMLDAVVLSDPYENMGLNILKEITAKIETESGNGRKTAIILAGAILREGLKVKDLSLMDLKREIDACLPNIINSLTEQSKKITPSNIGQVASVAAENEALGKLFQEIYKKIGKDGVIEIDNSNLPETTYEITEGVKLRGCGFTYPYMANSDKGRSALFLNPKILITKEKISTISQIDPIFMNLSKNGVNEIVIFCEDIDIKASEAIAIAQNAGVFKTLVIKAPTLWKDWLFEDFAKITGAKIINPSEGTSLKSFSMSWLGTCERINTTKEETIVTGIKDISEHLAVLKEKGDNDSKLRVAWLQTKTAILKLGANSESELSYYRGKASDARNSSYLALQEGVVAGGGVSLINAINPLAKTYGEKIMNIALDEPSRQILKNSGFSNKESVTFGGEIGFDSKTGSFVNMHAEGILDATVVVKNSVISAVSVISTLLTTKVAIIKPK